MACLLLSKSFAQTKTSFNFSIATNSNTSAGVFTKDGVLVKNLWSGIPYSAGQYTAYWDGTDDDGHLVKSDDYQVKVLTNNVKYEWQGVIGNTSSALSGNTVHHAFQSMYSLAFVGNNAYYSVNYNEQQTPIFTFNTANPQAKTSLLNKGAATGFVAADNNYVYWDATDANDTAKTFVYATKAGGNTEVTNFQYGKSVGITYSRTYASAIDYSYDPRSRISGLAVQKKGNLLFVAHKMANQLHILNKTTGALLKVITMNAPGGLTVDANDNLWAVTGVSLSRYSVDAAGNISAPQLTLAGLVAPIAVAVSPDGNTVAVADGGLSQQVKAYNNNTGAAIFTYGVKGGYGTGAAVTNDKFYFADLDGIRTYISYAPDGTLWVGDPGNCRVQHFSATMTYINRIMFMPHFYSTWTDPNNPTKVFADYLEFKIDYTKKLAPDNGSWTLVNNWGYFVPKDYSNQFFRFKCATTLSNGHTYAFLRHNTNTSLAMVEMMSTGVLRYTGIELPGLQYTMNADGSLLTMSTVSMGRPTVWSTRELTGFDGQNNPVWGPLTAVAQSSPATQDDPSFFGNGNSVITSSGVLVSFEGGLPPNGSLKYHLGGVRKGDNKWLWRTAKSTPKSYTGPYPADGAYDIGNGVQYAGSYVRALDRTLLWGYHGEFWKNSQVNKWTQVYDDGLFIGQFGVGGPEYTSVDAAPMIAGNAVAVSFVKDPATGNGYVFLNDESYHSGIHLWKVTGLNTISEQTVGIALPAKKHGLLGRYFNGTDLNCFKKTTTRVDPVINLLSSTLGLITGLLNPTSFSARWTGYIQPNYSEIYSIRVGSSRGVRLWIDDSLVIDKWNNSQNTEFIANMSLKANTLYPIKMEYYNTNSATATLSWSSASQPKQIIPTDNLYPDDASDTANGIDLLEGLDFRKVLVNNMYGWTRTPEAEEYINPYTKYWSVSSGYKSYDYSHSADLYSYFAQSNGTYTVSRTLGNNTSLTSWKLDGVLDFVGNAENDMLNKGGMFIDVLDNAGKIITRFWSSSVYDPVDPVMSIYANNAVIAKGGKSVIQPVMYKPQPFKIEAANGGLTFTYGTYAPVTAKVFDASSNWRNPQSLRLYFFSNGGAYTRIVDIKSMRFSKSAGNSSTTDSNPVTDTTTTTVKQQPASPGILAYPNPAKTTIKVLYKAIASVGKIDVVSASGAIMQTIGILKGSTESVVNVNALTPGYYTLVVTNATIVSSTPFIKIN